jgi:carboxylesterase type B
LGGQVAPTASALRALTAEEVIRKSPAPDPTLPNGSAFQPIGDGWVIPDDPAEVFESGRGHSVALIAGTNSDEGVAFTFFLAAKVKTVTDYSNYLKAQFGDLAATAAELYPANGDAEVRKALGQLFTDTLCLYGTRAIVTSMARTRRDIYAYYFTRSDPVSRKLGALGAIHGAEFGYTSGDPARSLFVGTPGLAVSADAYNDLDRTLAKTMNAAWVRFVKTGNPNGPAMPEWPAVKADDVKHLEFGDRIQAGSGLRERNLRFLADHFKRTQASETPAGR